MISGFMIVKDVLEQGYPFAEAIASALPVCDEFLVSDGYSKDGTYEVLEKIASLNPKVKVYRHQWPNKRDLTILADETNQIRAKCRFEHIFSVQANEIVHEQSVPFIKALPSMLPNVSTFSFPYINFLNTHRFTEEYRLRFAKNLPEIVAVGDAWTLGTSKAFERKKKLKGLAYPPRLSNYISNGIWFTYANPAYGPFSRAIYLPKPMFRYWSLFPKNFLMKCQGHSKLLGMDNYLSSLETLQTHVNDPATFWALSTKIFKKTIPYPEAYVEVEPKDHPVVIQKLLSETKTDHYYVREETLELIKKL
jgi:glycosyltransferase involved in cell wall biosynthesis